MSKITKETIQMLIAKNTSASEITISCEARIAKLIFNELKPAIDLYNMGQDYHKPSTGISKPGTIIPDPSAKGQMIFTNDLERDNYNRIYNAVNEHLL